MNDEQDLRLLQRLDIVRVNHQHQQEFPSMFLFTFGVLIAQGGFSHITQFDGALARTVHKDVALLRMEFSSCNHLGQFLHVGRFDVHNVCRATVLVLHAGVFFFSFAYLLKL